MAVGALVLFGMIGYRLPGQIRARRAELAAAPRGEDLEEAAEDDARSDRRRARRRARPTTTPTGPRADCPGPTVSTA